MNYQTMWLILISQSMLLGDGVAQPCYVAMRAKVGQTLLNHQSVFFAKNCKFVVESNLSNAEYFLLHSSHSLCQY